MNRKNARMILTVALALVIVLLMGGGVFWHGILRQAPPALLTLLPVGPPSRTEAAVTSVGRIAGTESGYGDCTRVLSIDGGGVRGLVPALILAEIERRTGRPIYEHFDLVVGTSTGAILALGLTRPSNADARKPAFAADDLVDLYRRHAASIFPSSFVSIGNLRRLFRPKFELENVESIFRAYFEDVKLMEALTNLAIPAYEIEEKSRLWFQTITSADGSVLMRDLVRGATAAPTYFSTARFAVPAYLSSKGYFALVDGAIFANNPVPEAYLFGRSLRGGEDKSMLLLSIGTGRSARNYTFAETWSWGLLGWMEPLLEVIFSDPATERWPRYWRDGPSNFLRLQAELGSVPIELDDSSSQAIQRLEASAAAVIKSSDFNYLIHILSLPRTPNCGGGLGADYERPVGPRPRAQ